MAGKRGFRGVFMSDTLPKKIKKFENGIVNLDISTGPGTHWVCYYNDPDYNFIEYFDPFGEYNYEGVRLNDVIIPKTILKYLKSSAKEIRYNSSFLQEPTSTKCGYFCMKYITERNKGYPPWDVLYDFTQEPSDYNENRVL
jgi:hypothetical protein